MGEIAEGNSAPEWPPGVHVAPELKTLVEDCLNRDASKRPSAESMLLILSSVAEQDEQAAEQDEQAGTLAKQSTEDEYLGSRFIDQTLTVETEDSLAYKWT